MSTVWRDNGLSLALFALFLITLGGQSVTGWLHENDERLEHGDPTQAFGEYLASGSFLEATMENWQSEFLAMWSMVVFSIYLRQRGSPESKPVDAAHSETG